MRVIAKDNLTLYPHTWTKGLDYELVKHIDYVTIASNEGQVNFTGEAMERLHEVFKKQSICDNTDFTKIKRLTKIGEG